MEYNSFLFNLILCFSLSFIIGIERQYRRRIVGLRTSILVSIGAFLFVSFSYLSGDVHISRVAAQVVSGIGFLGAGVIIKDGIKVRGLTTAATLWCDAAIGVLCAGGFIMEAIAGTIIILFSNIVLRNINGFILKKTDKRICRDYYNLRITMSKKNFYKLKLEMDKLLEKEIIEILTVSSTINRISQLEYEFVIMKSKAKVIEKNIYDLLSKYETESVILSKIKETKSEDLEEVL